MKTIAREVLVWTGRNYDWAKPLAGCVPVVCSGSHFYAKIPNTGGARDYTKFDPQEAQLWASTAPSDSIIVMDIEVLRDPVLRPVASDLRLVGPRQVYKDGRRLAEMVTMTRIGSGKRPTGIYGLIPTGFNQFNSVLLNDLDELAVGRLVTDFFCNTGLFEAVSSLNPTLYCTNPDKGDWKSLQKAWIRFAEYIFQELSRIDRTRSKRWVAFIKPTSQDGTLIPLDFWTAMISTGMRLGFDDLVAWQAGRDISEAELKPYIEILQAMCWSTTVQQTVDVKTIQTKKQIGRPRL